MNAKHYRETCVRNKFKKDSYNDKVHQKSIIIAVIMVSNL